LNINGSTGAATFAGSVTADGLTVGDSTTASPTIQIDSASQTWAGGENLGNIDWYNHDPSGIGAHTIASIHIENTAADFWPYSDMVFSTTGGNAVATEKMRIDSSGHAIIPAGVTLGTATGVYAAANTLDDYEEGAWIPTINRGTFTVSGADYTKVGNLVTLRANLQDLSDSTTAATISIGGLPFLPRAQYGSGSCMFRYFSKTNAAQMTAYIGSGATALTFYWSFNSNDSWAAVQFSDGTQTNMDIILTISYTTDL
jgi:hypothetical protein